MNGSRYLQFVLSLIAILLALLVVRPLLAPEVVHADAAPKDIFIEPGTTMLVSPDGSRRVVGKVVIDLRSGNVWGFPTLTDAPYPLDSTKTVPVTSRPFLLGRFDFDAMR
ncbi:MAG: hypothetical protein ACE14L_11995 [Terriglobales bacterium]